MVNMYLYNVFHIIVVIIKITGAVEQCVHHAAQNLCRGVYSSLEMRWWGGNWGRVVVKWWFVFSNRRLAMYVYIN